MRKDSLKVILNVQVEPKKRVKWWLLKPGR
jgi:hypothetical protein